ncbi:carbohydrate ABC transporter permease [Dactylosporangium salmoneum]|uniref:Carbohydrate ABC transporter permease n=1 Tax=Dactylosporangium salmoneum TaxID=53361 RepID=A0ABP5SPL8_9ACTN
MNKTPLQRVASWAFVVIITLSVLFPLAWMAIAAFKGKTEVLRSPFQFFPEMWNFDNYVTIVKDPEFSRAMVVTFIGALIFTALSLVVNSMAAYAFARLEFPGKKFWWLYCILPMFIPSMAILLTSFMVVSKLGMLNTMAVLIIPGVASAAQMFFLRQFYLGVPLAIEEAARIDGATSWQIFVRIFLPQSGAPFAVMGITAYLAYWNAYVWPILTITDPNLTQIMQFLGSFRTERGNDWGMLMAGSAIASLPTLVLLLFFQRFIVNGVRISGIK